MKKPFFLLMFPTISEGLYYYNENIKPFASNHKKVNNSFETNEFTVLVASAINSDKARGLCPDEIFLSYDCDSEAYNFCLSLVKGDHHKIKVVC